MYQMYCKILIDKARATSSRQQGEKLHNAQFKKMKQWNHH